MRAIELLATGRSIGYIAFDPRFVSDSAFITLSKDMTGTTPRGWLK
jgi:methylphosphotriester-DNA--protein-cysteine methyltransferase